MTRLSSLGDSPDNEPFLRLSHQWRPCVVVSLMLGLLLSGIAAFAQPPPEDMTPVDDVMISAPPASGSALEKRRAEEWCIEQSRFAITTYKPNYVLPLTYNARANKRFEELTSYEIKFQISLRIALANDFLGSGGNLAFGYTQLSFWQAFNKRLSSPFRETNHEPELMWGFWLPKGEEGVSNQLIILGFVHQSNGHGLPLSRSWNRLYMNLIFDYEDFYISFKPWFRIPERAKSSPTDPEGDDNPDIEDYLGYGEIMALWILGRNRVGLVLRNNLDWDDNRGAVQIDWSFPIKDKLQGYVQYFNGYGETLIDYNHSVNRLGVGLMLNNWL